MFPVVPFVLFGPAHLLTIAAIVLASLGLPLILKRWGSESLARRLEKGLALFLVVHELTKLYLLVAFYGYHWIHVLPLHLCSIAIFLTAALLLTRSHRIYEVVYFWGLGGTLQAVVTPDINWGFPELAYLSYFTSHGAIVVGAIYATLYLGLRPTWASIPRVFAITVAYAFLFIAPLNWLLDTNYLYLCRKPIGASILDHLGPWPWYLGSLVLVAIVSFFVYYSPFWLLDLWRARAEKRGSRETRSE